MYNVVLHIEPGYRCLYGWCLVNVQAGVWLFRIEFFFLMFSSNKETIEHYCIDTSIN